MIRVVLPPHLRILAGTGSEVIIRASGVATPDAVVDALEAAYPMLRGTIRNPATGQRRPMLRYFACREDISHSPGNSKLPDDVLAGREPLIILGAIAGG